MSRSLVRLLSSFRKAPSVSAVALCLALPCCEGGDSPSDPKEPDPARPAAIVLSAVGLEFASLGDTESVSATVSDLSGVRSVELYCIFINGGTQPEQYCGAFVQSGGNNWVIDYTPPPSFYSGTIKYRIKATDDSPLRNVSWWGTGYISVLPGIG